MILYFPVQNPIFGKNLVLKLYAKMHLSNHTARFFDYQSISLEGIDGYRRFFA